MKEDQRKLKGEETKNRILDAALHLISEGGLKAVSANKIAERAGISKSSIFHHYAAIEEIPYALVSQLCTMMMSTETFETIDDMKGFFEVIGEGTFKLKGQELVYYRTLFAFYNEAVYSGKYREQMDQLKHEFMKFLQTSIEALEGVKISDALAELITIDLDGLGLHYLIEEDSEKFMDLWCLKTQVYVEHIRLMK